MAAQQAQGDGMDEKLCNATSATAEWAVCSICHHYGEVDRMIPSLCLHCCDLRDEFARHAACGLAARVDPSQPGPGWKKELVRDAYKLADLMLSERVSVPVVH